jgi:hypothetical protein
MIILLSLLNLITLLGPERLESCVGKQGGTKEHARHQYSRVENYTFESLTRRSRTQLWRFPSWRWDLREGIQESTNDKKLLRQHLWLHETAMGNEFMQFHRGLPRGTRIRSLRFLDRGSSTSKWDHIYHAQKFWICVLKLPRGNIGPEGSRACNGGGSPQMDQV